MTRRSVIADYRGDGTIRQVPKADGARAKAPRQDVRVGRPVVARLSPAGPADPARPSNSVRERRHERLAVRCACRCLLASLADQLRG